MPVHYLCWLEPEEEYFAVAGVSAFATVLQSADFLQRPENRSDLARFHKVRDSGSNVFDSADRPNYATVLSPGAFSSVERFGWAGRDIFTRAMNLAWFVPLVVVLAPDRQVRDLLAERAPKLPLPYAAPTPEG